MEIENIVFAAAVVGSFFIKAMEVEKILFAVAVVVLPIATISLCVGWGTSVGGVVHGAEATRFALALAGISGCAQAIVASCCRLLARADRLHADRLHADRLNADRLHAPRACVPPPTLYHAPRRGAPPETDNATEAPHLLRCPITHALFWDPVATRAGHAYERTAIEAHFECSRVEPLSNVELDDTSLVPVHTLRALCDEFRALCDDLRAGKSV